MFRDNYKRYNNSIRPSEELMDKVLKQVKQKKKKIFKSPMQIAAAIALFIIVGGTTVFAASYYVKQRHVDTYENMEDFIDSHLSWETIGVVEAEYDETGRHDETAEAWIDRIYTDEYQDLYRMEYGTADTGWKRRLSKKDGSYIVYEYEKLSEAFLDNNISFNLEVIESDYHTIVGEYGCDFYYDTENSDSYDLARFFSGYSNGKGNHIYMEYILDYRNGFEEQYAINENYDETAYMKTEDGVEVFITKSTGNQGGKRVCGTVYTENSMLIVTMEGDFSENEIRGILNGLNIREAMHIQL